jgi:hypothetical protein
LAVINETPLVEGVWFNYSRNFITLRKIYQRNVSYVCISSWYKGKYNQYKLVIRVYSNNNLVPKYLQVLLPNWHLITFIPYRPSLFTRYWWDETLNHNSHDLPLISTTTHLITKDWILTLYSNLNDLCFDLIIQCPIEHYILPHSFP